MGHYYAYVRQVGSPSGAKDSGTSRSKAVVQGTRWVKLDDSRVTEISEAEVLRDAFGGGGRVDGAFGLQALLGQVRSAGFGACYPTVFYSCLQGGTPVRNHCDFLFELYHRSTLGR